MSVCQIPSKFLPKLQLNEKTWSHTGDHKKAKFLKVINNLIIYKFFKKFVNYKKMNKREVVFSCRCIPNIFKYCDHSLTFQKSRDQDSLRHKLKNSADSMKFQFHSSSELPLEHNENQKPPSNQIWLWSYLTNLEWKEYHAVSA